LALPWILGTAFALLKRRKEDAAMKAKVTLRVGTGIEPGKEFVFTRRAVGALGRADDCLVRVPNSLFYQDVSRHHCQFEVDPPEVRVRDLGSRNGTFVNGRLIGKRDRGQNPDGPVATEMPQYALHDGDELKVGATVFRVHVAERQDEEANEPDAAEMLVGCMHGCGCHR
jgi:pSer/pThr/pTyr-binding forkhead associated (FHA) protein